jgi:hypothetical protein
MNIYVASSWRNEVQPVIVECLRGLGHIVYDFRDSEGFHWSEVDPTVEVEGFADYGTRAANLSTMLNTPAARRGFARDMSALKLADACVLTLPCGRSAHLELGYAVGQGKVTAVLLDDPCQAELMYNMVDCVAPDMHVLFDFIGSEKKHGA